MTRKISLQTAIIIISFAAGFIVLMNGCVSKQNTAGIIGAPVVSPDHKYIVAVIAESEALSHQENGGFVQTNYNSTYWLKQYEMATGKLIKKKALISSAEKSNTTVTCYGSYDNKIWLHANELQAYDINTFEEVMNEEKLAAANRMNKNIFPLDGRLISASVENGYINFTGENGEEYRILLNSLKIINKKDLVAGEKDTGKKIAGFFNREDDYGIRCDSFMNKMFALAKDSKQVAEYNPANCEADEVAYRMKFFSAVYTMRRLGNHNSFDFSNITQQGDTTYLDAAFAKDLHSGNAIHLFQPAGYLIIHKDILGSNSKAILTRIDTANKKIWETATGISTKIAHCMVSGKYCIITANASYMFSPHIGKDALCIVDMETGNITRVLPGE
jgi:hypothetical protein